MIPVEYLWWMGAVVLATIGTNRALSRSNRLYKSWAERHPWSLGTLFWGLALIAVMVGVDAR